MGKLEDYLYLFFFGFILADPLHIDFQLCAVVEDIFVLLALRKAYASQGTAPKSRNRLGLAFVDAQRLSLFVMSINLLLQRPPSCHLGNFVNERDLEQVEFCLYLPHLLIHLLVELFLFFLELMDGCPGEFERIFTFHDFFIDFVEELLIMVGWFWVQLVNEVILIKILECFLFLFFGLVGFGLLVFLLLLICFSFFPHYNAELINYQNNSFIVLYHRNTVHYQFQSMYMDFLQKRQKFANQQRKKQREVIFTKNRTLFSHKDEPGGVNPQLNKIKKEKESAQNNSDWLIEQLTKLQINKDSINERERLSRLQQILEALPRWIARLNFKQNTSQTKNSHGCGSEGRQVEEQQMIRKIMEICIICLESSRLLVATTNCLIQVTSLSEEHLARLGIPEEVLAESFLRQCYRIFSQSTDMRIVFNCVYICGNIHKKFVSMSIKFAKTHPELGAQSFRQVSQLEDCMVEKMEQICSNYPHYEDCLEILIWFLKNCLLMYTKPLESMAIPFVAHRKIMIELKCIRVTRRIVVSLCAKLAQNIPFQSFSYFCSIAKLCFGLLSFVMSDSSIYRQVDSSMEYEHQGNELTSKSKSVVNESLLDVFDVIGQSVTVFMSVLQQNYEDSAKNEMLMKPIAEMSETMTQILINISRMKDYAQHIPIFIPRFCTLVAQGVIRCSEGAQTCSRLLEALANTQICTHFITRHLLQGCQQIYEHRKMVVDRSYRVCMLRLFQQLQDMLSHREVASIIGNLAAQESARLPHEEIKHVQDPYIEYLSFMLQHVIPPILRVVQILLIDKDPQNQQLGLKIIQKFARNWEVEEELLKNQLVKSNLSAKVIEMQEQKNQLVYNAALDLIEELSLDQLQ